MSGTANTYTGTTTINQGAVRASFQSGVFGTGSTGAVVLNGGGIVLANTTNETPTWNMNIGASGGTFQTGANGRWYFSSTLSGSGALALAAFTGGASRVQNQGLTNFNGKLSVGAVTLELPENSGGAATGDDVLALVNGSGILVRSSGTSGGATQGFTIGSGGGVLRSTAGSGGAVAAKISGAGGDRVPFGPGVNGAIVITNTANSYTGDTYVAGGFGSAGGLTGPSYLPIGGVGVIPAGAGKGNVVIVASNGAGGLDLNGFNQTVNGLSSFIQGAGSVSQAFSIWNLIQTAGYTADLDLLTITDGTSNSGAITTDVAAFTRLAAGSSNSFLASLSLANGGLFSNTYTLTFTSSKNGTPFNDSPRNLSVTVTGIIVVPEPVALALAGIGIAVAAWAFSCRK
jgi:hypothetical protein